MGGSKEEDNPKRKGFQVEVNLRLGAMRSLSEKERERERKEHNHNLEQIDRKERVCMHEKNA